MDCRTDKSIFSDDLAYIQLYIVYKGKSVLLSGSTYASLTLVNYNISLMSLISF